MKHIVDFIVCKTKEEYYSEFLHRYVDKRFHIAQVPVIVMAADFEHTFSEKHIDGTRQFSLRRARRMGFIEHMLNPIFPRELTFEPSTGNIAIFSVDLEAVLYLRPRPKGQTLQLATFFDFGKKHEQMYRKQKDKTIPLAENKIEAVVFGLTASVNADSHDNS